MSSSSAVPAAQKKSAHVVEWWADALASQAARIEALGPLFAVPTPLELVPRFDALVRSLIASATAFESADQHRIASAATATLAATTVVEKVRLAADVVLATFRRGNGSSSAREARSLVRSAGRQFLRLQLSDDGRVVEVLGALAEARHVVVLIPGMANDLSNYEGDLHRKAAALLEEMRAATGDGGVAVVAWLGYNTPDGSLSGLMEAARSTTARAAAVTLRADLLALRGMRPSAHMTIVAHSYGSVVLGAAMRSGLRIDDAVVVGSPGMDVDDRRDLGSPRLRLWAAHSPAKLLPMPFPISSPILVPPDLVAWAPAHGEDPAAEGFGAKRFATDGVGHSSYFDRGSLSLRNIARIATGRSPSKG